LSGGDISVKLGNVGEYKKIVYNASYVFRITATVKLHVSVPSHCG